MLRDQIEKDREIQSQLVELRKKQRVDSYKGFYDNKGSFASEMEDRKNSEEYE